MQKSITSILLTVKATILDTHGNILLYSQFSCFDVERIFGVDLVEEDLPDVVDVPLPLVAKASLHVHLVRCRIDERMEDIMIKNKALEDRTRTSIILESILSGLNFINVLHTYFTRADPESVKRY